MTSLERAPLVRLRAEVEVELNVIRDLLEDIIQRKARQSDLSDPVWLAYLAISIHRYYTALESTFERICRVFEGSLPSGTDTHHALLRDMALELPGIRPAVLQAKTVNALRPVLKFRHFVRHAYAVAWDRDRVVEIECRVHDSWLLAESDLIAFTSLLQEMATS